MSANPGPASRAKRGRGRTSSPPRRRLPALTHLARYGAFWFGGREWDSPSPLAGEGGFPRFALRKSDLEIRVRGAPPGDSHGSPHEAGRAGEPATGASRAPPASMTAERDARRGYPSPGFAKLAVGPSPNSALPQVCSPSETALSHKGRGGASSCAADRGPVRCVDRVALSGEEAQAVSAIQDRHRTRNAARSHSFSSPVETFRVHTSCSVRRLLVRRSRMGLALSHKGRGGALF